MKDNSELLRALRQIIRANEIDQHHLTYAIEEAKELLDSHSSTSYNQWPSEEEIDKAFDAWEEDYGETIGMELISWRDAISWLKLKLSESTQQESGGDMPEISAKSISDFDQWLKDHNK